MVAFTAGLLALAGVAGALFLGGVALPLIVLGGLGAGAFVAASVKVTDQWERAVLLLLGRYRGLRGPGYFAVVPIIDQVRYYIDQRIRTTAFGAESCLTRDTVPVNVDAIADPTRTAPRPFPRRTGQFAGSRSYPSGPSDAPQIRVIP